MSHSIDSAIETSLRANEGNLRPGTGGERAFTTDLDRAVSLLGDSFDTRSVQQVQVMDRLVNVITLDRLEADVWIEGEVDICLDVLPRKPASTFEPFEFIRKQADRLAGKVFGPLRLPVDCSMHGFRHGELIPRVSDKLDRGRDMFRIRIHDIARRPGAASVVVDYIKELEMVFTGARPPVEG